MAIIPKLQSQRPCSSFQGSFIVSFLSSNCRRKDGQEKEQGPRTKDDVAEAWNLFDSQWFIMIIAIIIMQIFQKANCRKYFTSCPARMGQDEYDCIIWHFAPLSILYYFFCWCVLAPLHPLPLNRVQLLFATDIHVDVVACSLTHIHHNGH